MALLWVAPLGLIVGLALGSLGGGGAILTVPALVYLLGQSPQAATTGSLIIVGLTALAGTLPHRRKGNLRTRQGVVFGLLGIAGSFLGARLAAGVAPQVLMSAFAGLMFVVGALMIAKVRRAARAGGGRETTETKVRPVRLVLVATGVGVLTGFFGVGGGFAVVPALVLVLGLSMPVAVGTSLLVIAINSATALFFRLGSGVELDWVAIGGFALFAVIGSLFGARVSQRISPTTLTKAFIVMLLTVATYMAVANVPALFG
ncbi:sulfite exporter TauE/SafE family protein [Enemella sp. A6]|uniref:sulfite exporter TauE/SafE family protein n=1 Tax=Enemella sp. A6 TaxID=3440152 RepID=UPI003EB6A015